MTYVRNSWDVSETVQSAEQSAQGIGGIAHTAGENLQNAELDTSVVFPLNSEDPSDLRRMNRLQLGQRLMAGFALGLCGIAGCVAAYGVTMHPDSFLSEGLLGFGLLTLGGLLFRGAQTWFQSELRIDPHNQEIQIVRLYPNGRQKLVMKRGFDRLSGVRIGPRDVTIFDHNGQKIAGYALATSTDLMKVRRGLVGYLPVFS